MKRFIFLIITGFASGLGGAYVYDHYLEDDVAADSAKVILSKQHDDTPLAFTAAPSGNSETSEFPANNDAALTLAPADFVEASEISTKCVVYIQTITEAPYASTWMDWFFGGGGVAQAISSGSGVIYSPDGYIMTNNHVIEDSDNIKVIIGKKEYDARVVGTDPSTDIAVLKVDARNLPSIRFASSKNVKIGDWVLAVGNPFNLTSTVTAGIVSAKGRELNITHSMFPIESFIQTDAAINPGNSGGALVNLKGELVGINTAILSKTGSYAGYGFAVPSDIVKKVVNDIINYGEVQKAFIGADVLDIDADIARKLDIDDYSGVVVSYVQKDGAAARVGLQKGDIIIKLDGEPIDSRTQFEEILSYKSPGDKVDLVFKRNNKIRTATVTLTNKEGTTTLLRKEIYTSRTLGADFEKVSKVERDLLNINHGVRIVKVRPGLITQMGLEEGFIITYINKVPIKDPETLTDILTKIRGRVYLEGVNKRGEREYYRYYF